MRHIRSFLLGSMMFLGVFTLGCSKAKGQIEQTIKCIRSRGTPMPATVVGEPILVRIADLTLTTPEFLEYFRKLPPATQRQALTSQKKLRDALDVVIDQKVIEAEARRLGLDQGKKIQMERVRLEMDIYRKAALDHLGPTTDSEAEDFYVKHKAHLSVRAPANQTRFTVKTREEAILLQSNLLKSQPESIVGIHRLTQGYEVALLPASFLLPHPRTLDSAKDSIKLILDAQKLQHWAREVRKNIPIVIDEKTFSTLPLAK
jgi:hypothetical protein